MLSTLLTIILILIGIGLVVLIALAISVIFQGFILARVVRREIELAGGVVRRALDGIASGAGLVSSLTSRRKASAKKKA